MTARRFRMTIWQRNTVTSYLFLLPFYGLFVIFVLAPFVWGLGMSFTEGGILEPARYVGLKNYQRVLSDFRVAIVEREIESLECSPRTIEAGVGCLDKAVAGAETETMFTLFDH